MTSYEEFDPDLPPEIQVEIAKQRRRRRMSDLLAEKGMQDISQYGRMVGNVYVPPSPFQGLAQMVSAYSARKYDEGSDLDYAGLSDKIKAGRDKVAAEYARTSEGVKPGEGGVPLMMEPVAPDPKGALMDMFASPYTSESQKEMAMLQYKMDEENKQANLKREDEQAARAQESKLTREQRQSELEANIASREQLGKDSSDLRRELAEMSDATRREVAQLSIDARNPPSPTVKDIIDPLNPDQNISIIVGQYDENKYKAGDKSGVVGVSTKLSDEGKYEAKNNAELQKKKPDAILRVSTVKNTLDKLKTKALELKDHKGLSYITGKYAGRVPIAGALYSQDASNAQAIMETIKSQVFINALQAMREASKTGGAVGNVSDREGDRMENAWTALSQSQDTETFKKRMQELIDQIDSSTEAVSSAYRQTYGEDPTVKEETVSTPQTEEEFNALPSGSEYIDPDDGKKYRKP